ncbi:MAG: hypothetical protein Q9227_001797 [Pyrenula ochraceoflavens]
MGRPTTVSLGILLCYALPILSLYLEDLTNPLSLDPSSNSPFDTGILIAYSSAAEHDNECFLYTSLILGVLSLAAGLVEDRDQDRKNGAKKMMATNPGLIPLLGTAVTTLLLLIWFWQSLFFVIPLVRHIFEPLSTYLWQGYQKRSHHLEMRALEEGARKQRVLHV